MAKKRRKERREERRAERRAAKRYAAERFQAYVNDGYDEDTAGELALRDTRAGFDISAFLALIIAFIEGLIELFQDED